MNTRWPGLVALLVSSALQGGCGKSQKDRPHATGGASGDATAGAGGDTAHAGSTAAGGSGGSVIGLGGTAGESDGGAAANQGGSSGAGGDPLAACEALDTSFTLSGDLPEGFGESVTLTAGCDHLTTGDHPWPFSFSYRPFEGPGIYHAVLACNADETLKVELTLHFQPSGMTARATFDANKTRVFTADTSSVEGFEATEQPFASWPYPAEDSAGLGHVFAGSFETTGASGGSENISASFAVCHVANIPRE